MSRTSALIPAISRFAIRLRNPLFPVSVLAMAAGMFISGCGTNSGTTTGGFTGNTAVTVLLTSTANDQLQQYSLGFTSLSLTKKDGTTVTLLTAQPDPGDAFSSVDPDFIHRNGSFEPLVTVAIPQGIYTAATATFDTGVFSCVTMDPSTGGLSFDEYGDEGNLQNVTLQLASPLRVTGSSMGLALNLQVSQSASFASCYQTGFPSVYSLTPTFSVAPVSLSATSGTSSSAAIADYDAEVASASSGGISVVPAYAPFSPPITIATGSGTVYQGIQSGSALAAGMFVNMDLAMQSDGSLLATRVDVENPAAVAMGTGPITLVCGSEPCLNVMALASQGTSLIVPFGYGSYFNFDSAAFHIYPGYSNVQNLPFNAVFSASTLAAGQYVYLTTATGNLSGGYPYTEASTITLVPQTLNGTVEGVSPAGDFEVYTVALASYDLFPTLAVQSGQKTVLSSPNTVEVYVDSSAQQLNSTPLAMGGTFRFTGLVFNDGGTLRMDCERINDGVAE